MITTVTTSAQLVSALARAADGDTIKLAPGTYATFTLRDVDFANGVTIESQDPANPAVLTGMLLKNSSGLEFRDLTLEVSPTAGNNQYYVFASQDVHFTRLAVHGTLDGNAQNDGGAILLHQSSNVSVTDSEFEQLSVGVSHIDSDHVTVTDNLFHDIRRGGVVGGGSSYVTIDHNTFRDFYPVPGDHPDAIQFWTSNTTVAAHDIVVTNNSFMRGAGTAAQGIFMRDERGDLPYRNVLIANNLIAGAMYHGITVTHGINVTVTDNIVQGFQDMKSWIRLEVVDGATVTNNSANMVTLLPTVTDFVSSGNTTVAQTADAGAWAYAQWLLAQGQGGLNIVGTAGIDVLTGSEFADTLTGGGGADVLTGGAGDDLYIISSATTVLETAGGGNDTVRSSVAFNLPANVENIELVGTTKGTYSLGNILANRMLGSDAANNLSGRWGADTIMGNGGADTIIGGQDNDRLIGGSGADVFVFNRGDGQDVITDFGAGGEHDRIDATALFAAGSRALLAQTAQGVSITFSTGEVIQVLGVSVADLHATAAGWTY